MGVPYPHFQSLALRWPEKPHRAKPKVTCKVRRKPLASREDSRLQDAARPVAFSEESRKNCPSLTLRLGSHAGGSVPPASYSVRTAPISSSAAPRPSGLKQT